MISSCPYLNFDLLVAEQWHQVRHDARVDDHLDLLVAGIRQVGQRPHRVHQDLRRGEVKSATSGVKSMASLKGVHNDPNARDGDTHTNIGVVDQHTERWENLRR